MPSLLRDLCLGIAIAIATCIVGFQIIGWLVLRGIL